MKVILAGGSGQIGRLLIRSLTRQGHACVILTRKPRPDAYAASVRDVAWDGRTLGAWCAELEGADAVVNLAGRSVDCRYTQRHLAEMLLSRTASTHAIGRAIAAAVRPPRVWLQAGTATIYADRFNAPNDEATGIIGGAEPDAPALWRKSVEIALAWEAELVAAPTPRTRKVILRSAMTMSPHRGGVFHVLATLSRLGLGRHGDGRQYVSWIHEHDFTAAIDFLLTREDIAGPVNVCAPHPLPNRDFMAGLHRAIGVPLAVPVPAWALEFGALLMRTETELILKSRRVVPARLLEAGFAFRYPTWDAAAAELVQRLRSCGHD